MCQMKIVFLLMVACATSSVNCAKKEEIFQQDLSDSFKIEGSDQGIQKVNLKCGSDSMHVMLETEKDFTGVMYTRGSFYKQAAPCFVKPSGRGAKSLEMTFSLGECQTQKDGDVFSNIVVIQNDPDLITPGDSAFSLECDFRKPRNVEVGADFQARDSDSKDTDDLIIKDAANETTTFSTTTMTNSKTSTTAATTLPTTTTKSSTRNKLISKNQIK